MDIGDAYIELIEYFQCDTKEELSKREGEIMRSMDCVNKCIPVNGDTIENRKHYLKQYNDENRFYCKYCDKTVNRSAKKGHLNSIPHSIIY
jgi:aspartate carbamoyltransferase regulatory subunit